MSSLRDFTMARVQLERAGNSIATSEVLRFQLAHALARDAVQREPDLESLGVELGSRGWTTLTVESAAPNRAVYLRRPDLGRTLDSGSHATLASLPHDGDIAIVIADGLSADAVDRHAMPLLELLIPALERAGWSRSPMILVRQGRVAIGDEIGEILGSSLVLVLIGERPGLTSPDSLGAYLTWQPRRGRTDAERNCISNIRPEGLPYGYAAQRLFRLLVESRQRRLSGFQLKEDFAQVSGAQTWRIPEIGEDSNSF